MTATQLGPRGEPVIQNPPTRIPDLTAISQYAALVGNRIAGTSPNRINFSSVYGFTPYPGLEYYETETANTFVYYQTGWVGTGTNAGNVAFASSEFTANGGGFQASRFCYFSPGRFTSAPSVATGIYTQAPQAQHAGVANVSADGFLLYYWRANQAATTVGWTAIPTDS